MVYRTISFAGFDGRAEALQKIKRYMMYSPMFYRTDVFVHSQRVCWIVEELLQLAAETLQDFDPELARTLALVHDDAEIVTGDIQLGHKLKMTPAQLATLDAEEAKAIEILTKRFPKKINGYSYKRLLHHALQKDCKEAQLMKCADRIDAFGESLHELFAGNALFTNPVEVYTNITQQFPKMYPKLHPLFKQRHAALQPILPDVPQILTKGTMHTSTSLKQDTGYPLYEFWKRVTEEHGSHSLLVEQKEH